MSLPAISTTARKNLTFGSTAKPILPGGILQLIIPNRVRGRRALSPFTIQRDRHRRRRPNDVRRISRMGNPLRSQAAVGPRDRQAARHQRRAGRGKRQKANQGTPAASPQRNGSAAGVRFRHDRIHQRLRQRAGKRIDPFGHPDFPRLLSLSGILERHFERAPRHSHLYHGDLYRTVFLRIYH